MLEHFAAHYALTEVQLKELWSEGLIVLDANVLLNLYRYSPKTRKDLLSVLTKAKPQLWLPHQAGQEFHENRIKVIQEEIETYANFLKEFDAILDKLDQGRGHPFTTDKISTQLKAARDALAKDFENTQEELKGYLRSDPILNSVTSIFSKRVGNPLSEKELTELPTLGEARYAKRIPPGYEDRKKAGDQQYGDLILWLQIMKQAEDEQTPVLLVTDDRKTDWWSVSNGRTIGPLPALRAEICSKSNRLFHMYQPFQFLKYASGHFGTKVNAATLKEVQEAQSSHRWIHGIPVFKSELPVVDALSLMGYSHDESLSQYEQYESLKNRLAELRAELAEYEAMCCDPNVNSSVRGEIMEAMSNYRDMCRFIEDYLYSHKPADKRLDGATSYQQKLREALLYHKATKNRHHS